MLKKSVPTAAEIHRAVLQLYGRTQELIRRYSHEPTSALQQEYQSIIDDFTAINATLNSDIFNAKDIGGTHKLKIELAPYILFIERSIENLKIPMGWRRLKRRSLDVPPVSNFKSATNMLSNHVKQWKQRNAYNRLWQGRQWHEAGLHNLTNQMNSPNPVQFLSQRNIDQLKVELSTGIWEKQKQLIFDHVINLPFVLKHATDSWYVIQNSGRMISYTELRRENPDYVSNYSSPNNLKNLNNDDFVFFRLDIGVDSVKTRYGETQVMLQPDLLFKNGWISLHDQLMPLDRESMHYLYDQDGFLIRKTDLVSGHKTRCEFFHLYGKGGKKVKDFPKPDACKRRDISFLDEVFYAGQIKEGLALSFIRELHELPELLNYICEKISILKGDEHNAFLAHWISRFFRPEAKIPVEVLGPNSKLLQLIKPAGDYRYKEDGSRDAALKELAALKDELAKLRTKHSWTQFSHGVKRARLNYAENQNTESYQAEKAAKHKLYQLEDLIAQKEQALNLQQHKSSTHIRDRKTENKSHVPSFNDQIKKLQLQQFSNGLHSDYPISDAQATYLTNHNLMPHYIEPDGNCAYYCIQKLLRRQGKIFSVSQLRELVSKFIQDNPDATRQILHIIDPHTNHNLAELRRQVVQPFGFFGIHGDIALPILCFIFNLNVNVIHPNSASENIAQTFNFNINALNNNGILILTTYGGDPAGIPHYYLC